uniref:Uncharacterized protein n=1 Tax=Gossypium raimondii TaxID=29730 RepID=A0A0D2VSN1_GOSRA|nr:hypothetical protein B456_011G279800 [Gossypium raimondii]
MNFSSMEALFSTSFMSNMDWFHQENQNTYWTKEENKRFEHALAIYGDDVPDRWIKVAEMIPGKTVLDVIKQYRELEEDVSDIEAGRIPIPGYPTSSFTLELVDNHDFDGYRKRPNGAKGHDHERKKDKRRPSIHDITVLNLSSTTTFSDHRKAVSINQSNVLTLQHKIASMSKAVGLNGSVTVFDSGNGNRFTSSQYQAAQNLYGNAYHGAHIKHQSSVF